MHSVPFHRRLLPLIFIVAFAVIAPALVFYTAGYRWNSKKGKIERNGTVIIDSTPAGADIAIDGRFTTLKTPVTIQDMTPGIHRISISRNGYSGWEKALDVRSERVTFANNVWLWPKSEAVLSSADEKKLVVASPQGDRVLDISAASPTRMTVSDADGRVLATSVTAEALGGKPSVSWSPDGRHVLVGSDGSSSEPLFLLVSGVASRAPVKLPDGAYRWLGDELSGNVEGALLTIRLSDMSVSREPLPSIVNDAIAGGELRTAPGTGQTYFATTANPTRGFLLPQGQWTFWSLRKNDVMLRDGTSWLSFSVQEESLEYRRAQGDRLRPFVKDGITKYLLVNGTEIWVWNPKEEPVLVYRQSENIVDAAWHRAGFDVFFATDKTVSALNLDPRDGHLITNLASFDRVTGLAVLESSIRVSGTKNGRTGVWSLPVE